MPNKNIKIQFSLLNCGAIILNQLNQKETISSLWEKSKTKETLMNYEKFILTLDYLFIIGAIKIENGLIMRCIND